MTQKVRKHRKWLWVMEIVLVLLLVTGIVYVSDVSHVGADIRCKADGVCANGKHNAGKIDRKSVV